MPLFPAGAPHATTRERGLKQGALRMAVRCLVLSLVLARAACARGVSVSAHPPVTCELNVEFGASLVPGAGSASAALRLVNNQLASLSSWQVLWTLSDDELLLGETVQGALLINPGGRAPCLYAFLFQP